jgi:serine/threonine protein kinase
MDAPRAPVSVPGDPHQRTILSGPSNCVYSSQDWRTGVQVAVKVAIDDGTSIRNEIRMLESVSHSAILNPVAHVRDRALVFPFAAGGDLLSVIEQCVLTESTAKRLFFRIAEALAELHSHRIWHRDIKPENILLLGDPLDPDAAVLSDFGLARKVESGICDDEWVGSLQYAAPELLRKDPYGEKIDIWAFGITVYAAMMGRLPFRGERMRAEILAGLPMLVDYGLEDASPECEDVVMAMLKVNPEERPTARQLLMHPWFDDVREAPCKAPIQRGIPRTMAEDRNAIVA